MKIVYLLALIMSMTTQQALQHLFVTNWESARRDLKDSIVKKLYVIRTRFINDDGKLSLDKKEEALKIAGYKVKSEKQWSKT